MITTFFIYALGAIGGLFALGFTSLAFSYAKLVVDTKRLRYEREVESIVPQEEMLKILLKQSGLSIKSKDTKTDNSEDEHNQSWEILKKMIDKSPNHPEIAEIEADDNIIGVFFEGNVYPPELS